MKLSETIACDTCGNCGDCELQPTRNGSPTKGRCAEQLKDVATILSLVRQEIKAVRNPYKGQNANAFEEGRQAALKVLE